MNKPIAVIPARGGSKRIPMKNIKSFCSKPLISYSISTAIKSDLFERVIVSTDHYEIAKVAMDAGAEVPFMRSESLSDDFTGTAEVILDCIGKIDTSKSSYICCIYPTAPLLTIKNLAEGFHNACGKDGAISVGKFQSKIQRALKINDGENLHFVEPSNINVRSNNLEDHFFDAGQFYWLDINRFKSLKTLWMPRMSPVIIEDLMVQDIDTMEDWEVAEFKYKLLNKREKDESSSMCRSS